MAANIVIGILLFVFPLTLSIVPLEYTGIPICSVATFAAVQEVHFIRTGKKQDLQRLMRLAVGK